MHSSVVIISYHEVAGDSHLYRFNAFDGYWHIHMPSLSLCFSVINDWSQSTYSQHLYLAHAPPP